MVESPKVSPTKTRERTENIASVLVLLVAATLTSVRLVLSHGWIMSHPEFFRSDSAWPLIFNHDGWWYLRLAREGLQTGSLWDVPALSALLAVTAEATGFPLEVVAFWLPALCTLLLLPVVFLWGKKLAGNVAGAMAVIGTVSSPYWAELTGFGMLDTKCLAPALLGLAALALSGFAEARKSRAVVHLTLFGIIAAAAVWWWKPSAGFCMLSLGAALSARAATSKTARLVVLIMGMVVAGCAVLVMAGEHEALPALARDILRYAERHVALVFRTDASSAAMADSIVELTPASFAELSRMGAGSLPAMAFALAGLCLAFAIRPKEAAPLTALILALAMALPARRMILLFVPAMGVGFGIFSAWLAGYVDISPSHKTCSRGIDHLSEHGFWAFIRKHHMARVYLAFILSAVVLLPAIRAESSKMPVPPFTLQMDALALSVKWAVPPDTVVWTWWDYGYFLQDRTGLPTFFDGGSQTEDDCFVAAFPLASSDPVLAANWIRFFAKAGQGEFGRIAARVGSRERALNLLVRLFSGREDRGAILAELSGDSPSSAATWFFPDVNACLVLPRQFLDISGHWMAYASPPGIARSKTLNHIDVLPSIGLEVEPDKERLNLPYAALAKGYTFVPSAVELGEKWDSAMLFEDKLADPILFYRKGSPLTYITDKLGARTLAFWLLAPTGFSQPLFKLVKYDPETGGAWIVGRPPPL